MKGAPQDVDTEAHAMVTVAAFRVEAGDKAPLAAHATQTRARVTKDIESERLLAEDDESLPSPSRGSKDGDEDYR